MRAWSHIESNLHIRNFTGKLLKQFVIDKVRYVEDSEIYPTIENY